MALNPYKSPSHTTASEGQEPNDGWYFRYVAPIAVVLFCFGVVGAIVSFLDSDPETGSEPPFATLVLLLFGLLIPGRNVKIIATALILACLVAVFLFSRR